MLIKIEATVIDRVPSEWTEPYNWPRTKPRQFFLAGGELYYVTETVVEYIDTIANLGI